MTFRRGWNEADLSCTTDQRARQGRACETKARQPSASLPLTYLEVIAALPSLHRSL